MKLKNELIDEYLKLSLPKLKSVSYSRSNFVKADKLVQVEHLELGSAFSVKGLFFYCPFAMK